MSQFLHTQKLFTFYILIIVSAFFLPLYPMDDQNALPRDILINSLNKQEQSEYLSLQGDIVFIMINGEVSDDFSIDLQELSYDDLIMLNNNWVTLQLRIKQRKKNISEEFENNLIEVITEIMRLSTEIAYKSFQTCVSKTPIESAFKSTQFLYPLYNKFKEQLSEKQIAVLNELRELLVIPLTKKRFRTVDDAQVEFRNYGDLINPLVRLVLEYEGDCELIPFMIQYEALQQYFFKDQSRASLFLEFLAKILEVDMTWFDEYLCDQTSFLKKMCPCLTCEDFKTQWENVYELIILYC